MRVISKIILISSVVFLSCKDDPVVVADDCGSDILKIQYGKSFGFCGGYCWHEITVTSNRLTFQKKSWDNSVPPVTCERDYDCEDWKSLTEDINVSDFFNMEEVIGCPDCADQGAGWVTIFTGGDLHKVTYEYHTEPKELTDLVNVLRPLLDSFDKCEHQN